MHSGTRATRVIDTAKLIAAELAEIEENLIRRDLDAATRALLTSRRQEIIASVDAASMPEGKDPWGKDASPHRGARRKGQGIKGAKAPGSQRAIAEVTGRSKSSVDRDLKRAKTLGSETLGKVAGTNLGTGPLPELQRHQLVERAAKGERVSTKEQRARDGCIVKGEPRTRAAPDRWQTQNQQRHTRDVSKLRMFRMRASAPRVSRRHAGEGEISITCPPS